MCNKPQKKKNGDEDEEPATYNSTYRSTAAHTAPASWQPVARIEALRLYQYHEHDAVNRQAYPPPAMIAQLASGIFHAFGARLPSPVSDLGPL